MIEQENSIKTANVFHIHISSMMNEIDKYCT